MYDVPAVMKGVSKEDKNPPLFTHPETFAPPYFRRLACQRHFAAAVAAAAAGDAARPGQHELQGWGSVKQTRRQRRIQLYN